jgi:hypothetical protein
MGLWPRDDFGSNSITPLSLLVEGQEEVGVKPDFS